MATGSRCTAARLIAMCCCHRQLIVSLRLQAFDANGLSWLLALRPAKSMRKYFTPCMLPNCVAWPVCIRYGFERLYKAWLPEYGQQPGKDSQPYLLHVHGCTPATPPPKKHTHTAALQSSHEVHIAKLDALEDRLVAKEIGAANALADKNTAWQEQRHRWVAKGRP